MYDPNWANIAFMAFAPVLAAWIVAYSLIFTVRWVKRGFDANAKRED